MTWTIARRVRESREQINSCREPSVHATQHRRTTADTASLNRGLARVSCIAWLDDLLLPSVYLEVVWQLFCDTHAAGNRDHHLNGCCAEATNHKQGEGRIEVAVDQPPVTVTEHRR